MAIIFPNNPGSSIPANTFSPTSTPPNTYNNLTYIWDNALGVWTSSAGGGGGGGVTGVNVTGPITNTGTASVPDIGIAPATTASAGSLSAADKTKIDALPATIVAAITGTAPVVIAGTASNPDVTVQLASAAEAAAGTDATKLLTPATGVPKTPADMTGAALIPGGDDSERPGTLVTGMLRYNDQAGLPAVLEFYDGSGWVTVPTGGAPLNNVIYGQFQWTNPLGTEVINHASVNLAKSYIILNSTSNSSASPGQAYISARTSSSFTIQSRYGTTNSWASYFLVY